MEHLKGPRCIEVKGYWGITQYFSVLFHFNGFTLSKTICCGLYYKPMKIINDDSRIINKLEASLTDYARVVIYDYHMFIVQATGVVYGVVKHSA